MSPPGCPLDVGEDALLEADRFGPRRRGARGRDRSTVTSRAIRPLEDDDTVGEPDRLADVVGNEDGGKTVLGPKAGEQVAFRHA